MKLGLIYSSMLLCIGALLSSARAETEKGAIHVSDINELDRLLKDDKWEDDDFFSYSDSTDWTDYALFAKKCIT